MSIANNILIAKKWFDCFNNKDLEQLLELYDDKAIHYSPKLKLRQPDTYGLIMGKPALRIWWQDAFNRLPGLQYLPTCYTANKARVVMEYIREAPGEPEMFVAEVLEIINGKIVCSKVYHG